MSGKESTGYKCVREHIDTISDHLKVNRGAKKALIIKYIQKEWFDIDVDKTRDETELVMLALNRISIDAREYDTFMEMLTGIAGTNLIVKTLKGKAYFSTSYLGMMEDD